MVLTWRSYLFAFFAVALFSLSMAAVSVYYQPHQDLRRMPSDYSFKTNEFVELVNSSDSLEREHFSDKVIIISGNPARFEGNDAKTVVVFNEGNTEITCSLDPQDRILNEEHVLQREISLKCFCAGVAPESKVLPGIIQLNRCLVYREL